MLVPIYQTPRRHNSVYRTHQTHHPGNLKYRKQSKDQNRNFIHMKPPVSQDHPLLVVLDCLFIAFAEKLKLLDTDWLNPHRVTYRAMAPLTATHHLIRILKMV